MTSTFLEGLRVVELSEVWAGPMAGSIFGDLGADVVKVESYPRNSLTRMLFSPAPGPGEGPAYERAAIHHISNRNKRNITLNVRTEEGAQVLRDLIASADVVFESYSAGTIDRMGFGWDVVKELNPRLIFVSMPGWGANGPYKGYVTLGSGLDAAGGHTAVRGDPKRPIEDTRPIYHSDATGALALGYAVMTAMHQREQTGAGVYLDISQIEVLNWHLPAIVAEWAMNQRIPERIGNSDPLIVPHGCFRAAAGEAGDDAWIVIAAEDDAQWAKLAGAMGSPEWAKRGHPWATIRGRLAAREEIHAAIAAFASTAIAEDLAGELQADDGARPALPAMRLARGHAEIGAVQPGGAHADQHLLRLRPGLGHVLDPHAGFGDDGGLHGVPPGSVLRNQMRAWPGGMPSSRPNST